MLKINRNNYLDAYLLDKFIKIHYAMVPGNHDIDYSLNKTDFEDKYQYEERKNCQCIRFLNGWWTVRGVLLVSAI